MSSRKAIWAGLDAIEAKTPGEAYKNFQKERVRQGYKPEHQARTKAMKKKTETLESRSKKAGYYVHGHKNFGDVYED